MNFRWCFNSVCGGGGWLDCHGVSLHAQHCMPNTTVYCLFPMSSSQTDISPLSPFSVVHELFFPSPTKPICSDIFIPKFFLIGPQLFFLVSESQHLDFKKPRFFPLMPAIQWSWQPWIKKQPWHFSLKPCPLARDIELVQNRHACCFIPPPKGMLPWGKTPCPWLEVSGRGPAWGGGGRRLVWVV